MPGKARNLYQGVIVPICSRKSEQRTVGIIKAGETKPAQLVRHHVGHPGSGGRGPGLCSPFS